MTQIELPQIFDNDDTELPLPLRVAQKWNFPLAHIQNQDGYFYSVQDWIKGLTDTPNPIVIWADIKRRGNMPHILGQSQQVPYTARDGKTYQMDFVDDKGLYLIAQYLRVTKKRPILDKIKRYLAGSGAFVDLVNREPDTVITSGAINPDEAIDAAIRAYRAQGKSDKWIVARITGKIKREKFTRALQAAVAETLLRKHYAMATDEVYLGL